MREARARTRCEPFPLHQHHQARRGTLERGIRDERAAALDGEILSLGGPMRTGSDGTSGAADI